MNPSKTYKGIFWIAGEEDNSKNGLLKFSNGVAYVELFDSFDKDPINIKTKQRDKICCIHGVLEDQYCCILNNCELKISNGLGSILETRIKFDYFYYSSNRDLILKKLDFEKVEFNLDNLFPWIGNTSIETVQQPDGKYGLNYKEPKKVDTLFSSESHSLKIKHITSIPLITDKKNITIEQDTTLILESNSNHSITESFVLINKIHDLFILINADKVELDSTLEFTTNTNEKGFFGYNNLKRFGNAKGFSKQGSHNLFTLSSLQERIDLNLFFSSWFSMYQYYKYPIELLIECLSNASMNVQHKFINLMYSLDVMQQQGKITGDLIGNIELSTKEKNIIEKLKNEYKVDNNTINSLTTRLKKIKKPDLKAKINKFLNPYSDFIHNLFGESLADFVEITVNTRNYLSHENNTVPRLEIEAFDKYNLKLEAIILTIFLHQLGIKLNDIELQVKMHNRFQRVIRRT